MRLMHWPLPFAMCKPNGFARGLTLGLRDPRGITSNPHQQEMQTAAALLRASYSHDDPKLLSVAIAVPFCGRLDAFARGSRESSGNYNYLPPRI